MNPRPGMADSHGPAHGGQYGAPADGHWGDDYASYGVPRQQGAGQHTAEPYPEHNYEGYRYGAQGPGYPEYPDAGTDHDVDDEYEAGEDEFDEDGGLYEDDGEPLVRPYAMTGGRTRPRYQLAIEALVQTTGQAQGVSGLLPEHQQICRLCQDVKSVAEISALLTIPLGVARILVADLAEAGVVAIHQPGGADAGQPDVTLLERVLSGLRKL
ncbi:DUF742 domain-containing protein [Allostreptomyces psammosilenae]|uniref:DUF742 domain-containing protein n=1 Tax=Allostreptomyces psammosilenae TaxID=1892865 RepID=A0A852ZZC0_9ACTN|nr:DUF742 domain-containing protein [Allostreptomyces psammosilenae]NYI06570.1 hypothetical protein [Allostreptomyces psammosilenae]